jgi:hypothetical protein
MITKEWELIHELKSEKKYEEFRRSKMGRVRVKLTLRRDCFNKRCITKRTHEMVDRTLICVTKECRDIGECPVRYRSIYCSRIKGFMIYQNRTNHLFNALNESISPIELKKICKPRGITKKAKRRIQQIIEKKETNLPKSIRMVMLTINKRWKKSKNKIFIDEVPSLKQIQDYMNNERKKNCN